MPKPNKPLEQMTAQERLALGRSYYNEGKFDEAIKTWSEIRYEDDLQSYADAQVNLGNLYDFQENQEKAEETHQKAIEAYQEVPKSDRQAYSWAWRPL